MKKYTFITLYITLSKTERSEFAKYLNRVCTKEHHALAIYNCIVKNRSSLIIEGKLNIDQLYHKCYKKTLGTDKLKRKKILNSLSDLKLYLKDFLIKETISKDSLQKELLWLSVLKEKDLGEEIEKQIVKLKTRSETLENKSILDYLTRAIISYIDYFHFIQNHIPKNPNLLMGHYTSLDIGYSLCELKVKCEMHNMKNIYSHNLNLDEFRKKTKSFLKTTIITLLFMHTTKYISFSLVIRQTFSMTYSIS